MAARRSNARAPSPEPDAEGVTWWEAKFGERVAMDDLRAALKCDLPQQVLTTIVETIIPNLSDRYETKDGVRTHVHKSEWKQFLLLFGPFESCLERCRASLFDDQNRTFIWFHGCEDGKASSEDLKGQPMGSYLIRTSPNIPHAFVVQYTKVLEGKECEKKSLVFRKKGGYAYRGDDRPVHQSLALLVASDPDLKHPVVSKLVLNQAYAPVRTSVSVSPKHAGAEGAEEIVVNPYRPVAGIVGEEKDPDEFSAAALAAAKSEIEGKLGTPDVEMRVLAYKTQTVAGLNFFMKLEVDGDRIVHARVYRDLQGNYSLNAIKADVSAFDELDYFQAD